MSLLWYYRPEHTEQGRQDADGGEEVFASKHKDHNSVACIEDKCYVLTLNEYCRWVKGCDIQGFAFPDSCGSGVKGIALTNNNLSVFLTRYRRILKGIEENVDLPPPLVPGVLHQRAEQEGMLAPKVPLNTSPELVMFCNRVYEFRFKRMKNFY